MKPKLRKKKERENKMYTKREREKVIFHKQQHKNKRKRKELGKDGFWMMREITHGLFLNEPKTVSFLKVLCPWTHIVLI